MANPMHRLHLLKCEEEPDWDEDLNREQGLVLDDEQVAHLLLGAPLRMQRDCDREPAVVIGAATEGDALASTRGVMGGFALMIPVWSLIAAILVSP